MAMLNVWTLYSCSSLVSPEPNLNAILSRTYHCPHPLRFHLCRSYLMRLPYCGFQRHHYVAGRSHVCLMTCRLYPTHPHPHIPCPRWIIPTWIRVSIGTWCIVAYILGFAFCVCFCARCLYFGWPSSKHHESEIKWSPIPCANAPPKHVSQYRQLTQAFLRFQSHPRWRLQRGVQPAGTIIQIEAHFFVWIFLFEFFV